MKGIQLSNHALLRWLERGMNIDIDGLRASIEHSLSHAHAAAESIGGGDYLIVAGGMVYAVREGVVTTVLQESEAHLPRVMKSHTSE